MTDKIRDLHETIAFVRELQAGLATDQPQNFVKHVERDASVLKMVAKALMLEAFTYDVVEGLIADLMDEYSRENAD